MSANDKNQTLKIVPSPDAQREELTILKEEIRRLMRLSSKETDIGVQSQLQVQIAGLNRKASKLMEDLGLANVFKPDPKKESRRKFLPTQDLTVDQLLTLAAAGKTTPEGAAALAELRTVAGARAVIMPWVPPAFPPAPDASSVASWMNGCATYSPLQGVLRCPKDPHFKPTGGLKNLATVTQPPQYVGQDGEWIALLQQLPNDLAKYREPVREALEAAVAGYYVASGPQEGWLKRIRKGDARPHPEFKLVGAEVAEIFRVLPWQKDLVPNFKTSTLLDMLKQVIVNGAAGSGFPRYFKKAVVMKEMLQDAAQYYDLLNNKQFVAYQQKYPGEFLTQAKMKLDRYEAEDWGEKVRPYYNLNGGLALLYSCITQAYSHALVGFWVNPESCNAHGFAWNSGGGNRLYRWVVWAAKQPPGTLSAIGYSDDGLWVYVAADGHAYVSDRDIAQCDASLGKAHLPQYRAHLLAVLEEQLSQGWRNIAQASAAAVFTQVVILYKSLVYLSTNKVHSGVPGTAEADQVGFATLYTLIKAEMARMGPQGDPEAAFAQASGAVTKRIGLEFKPAKWHLFEEARDSYEWEFLGKRLERFRDHYIPVVTLQKAVIQLVTPKANKGGLEGQRSWMERARGLAVTSLYTHPALYEMARAAFKRKLELRIQPAATMDGEETGENDLDQILGQGVTIRFPDANFPTRQWIYALYTGAVAEGAKAEVVTLVAVRSAADVFAEAFPEEQGGKDWADTDPDPTLERAKVELEEGQRIQGIHVKPAASFKEQVGVVGLPEEVKQAYRDGRRAAFRSMGAAFETKKGKYVRGGMMERLLFRPDDAQVVFTKTGMKMAWEGAETFDEGTASLADEDEWALYHPADMEADDEIDRRLADDEFERLEKAYERSRK